MNFRQLSNPKEEGFTLQMWQDDNYDSVSLLCVQQYSNSVIAVAVAF